LKVSEIWREVFCKSDVHVPFIRDGFLILNKNTDWSALCAQLRNVYYWIRKFDKKVINGWRNQAECGRFHRCYDT
jgi:hypothetical protein